MHGRLWGGVAALIAITALVAGPGSAQTDARFASDVDRIFSRWTSETPGCAVGVARDGRSVLERAYGLAELEHDVPNTPETIFEAGSVSKQFTAAAILLLARDGRLSLDDPVRKYVPELPDYGQPLTIRHMLTHTSGLRDWGGVAAIAGWPRTTRVHTHAHVLDIVSRQRSLNFPPGTRYSYSNTGYNLAAIVVARVSGQPFAEFTRTRIFEPLGMSRTSWRDDYTRIVKRRAPAYADTRGGFRLDMPFENVHGNGGLLTTVGDLLRWTANFGRPRVGDAGFVREAQTPGRFNDGRSHEYALGLRVATYKGVREVGHSGATAGYRAYLASYPDADLSVAVLCNVSSGAAAQYAHAVADLYLGPLVADSTRGAGVVRPDDRDLTVDAARLDALAGLYRNLETGEPLRIVRDGGALRLDGGPELRAESESRWMATAGRAFEFGPDGSMRLVDQFGSAETYSQLTTEDQGSRPLEDFAGTYHSDEAEVSMTISVEKGVLVLGRRPDTSLTLTPVYADGFRAPLGFVRFHRDDRGRVTAFSVSQDRVWDLRFSRIPPAGR